MSGIAMIKDAVRKTCIALGLDLTKNLEYDRLSILIMKKVIKTDSNCVDIGCHKGEILELMLSYAPSGHHYAFEPIPELHMELARKFGRRVEVMPYALSDKNGSATFNHVVNAEAYSGLQKRKYETDSPEIHLIEVETRKLDDLIPADEQIDFIKLDVEGGEFLVLKGALRILKALKTTLIFECGIGASDYYGTNPKELYSFIHTQAGLRINTLKGFVGESAPLTEQGFVHLYNSNKEYYFVAHP